MTKKIIFLALCSLLLAPCSAVDAQQKLKLEEIETQADAIYPQDEFVEAGGLMSYGTELNRYSMAIFFPSIYPSLLISYRRAAGYVDKILKGAKPADLPVQQATKFEFVINLKAAKQINLTVPPEVLARANKVIK
jgi:putative tryptophan/tyrosine transport system substrate-binding protein